MADQILDITRTSDAEIVQALKGLAADCKFPNAKCWVTLFKDHRPIETDLVSMESDTGLELLFKQNSALTYEIRVRIEQWGGAVSITRRPEHWADQLRINLPTELDKNNVVELMVSITKHFDYSMLCAPSKEFSDRKSLNFMQNERKGSSDSNN